MFVGADPSFARDRLKSAGAVAVLHALLFYALVAGFSTILVQDQDDALKLFSIRAPTPPPTEPPRPATVRRTAREGAAAPENLRSRASPVVAPTPRIELPLPPTVVVAPVPGVAHDPDSGASNRPGPGMGAGGEGNGTGSGRRGDGTGAGAGGPARLIRGRIANSDYPRSAWRDRIEGEVVVHLEVAPTGRVSECRVARSSGNGDLDSTTCRLIVERFRYAPALDGEGRAVPAVMGWRQSWWLE